MGTIVATVTAQPSRSKGYGWATIDDQKVSERAEGHTAILGAGRLVIVTVSANLRRASGRRDVATRYAAVTAEPGSTVIVSAGSPQRYEVTVEGVREWDIETDGRSPSHVEALRLLSDPLHGTGMVRFRLSGDTYHLRGQVTAAGGTWDPTSKTWQLSLSATDEIDEVVRLIERLPPTVITALD